MRHVVLAAERALDFLECPERDPRSPRGERDADEAAGSWLIVRGDQQVRWASASARRSLIGEELIDVRRGGRQEGSAHGGSLIADPLLEIGRGPADVDSIEECAAIQVDRRANVLCGDEFRRQRRHRTRRAPIHAYLVRAARREYVIAHVIP